MLVLVSGVGKSSFEVKLSWIYTTAIFILIFFNTNHLDYLGAIHAIVSSMAGAFMYILFNLQSSSSKPQS